MINKLKIIRAEGLYPYRNQAIEKYLLDTCKEGEMILYLWANDKTVFIGKNQNAYTECDIESLADNMGYLARRFTGGGAVYHDKGNLNFTFITCREDYDISNQFAVILDAMRALGFNAEINGRNDLVIDGKKFSGNAFYKSRTVCLHHGTILICSNKHKISKYLKVSRFKLNAKGVKSVASRVCNLSDYRWNITAREVASALQTAFINRFPNAERSFLKESDLPEDKLKILTVQFADRNYILGDDIHYGAEFENRYEWGVADIRLEFNGDIIEKAKIYSDALDTEAVELKEKLLTGLDLNKPADPRIKDIIDFLKAENK
ncbi:MAG: lipoate--protein ligase [Clostridiales bacterium]|nr:lipoate--protein ligase [Clostridiales bacterium]